MIGSRNTVGLPYAGLASVRYVLKERHFWLLAFYYSTIGLYTYGGRTVEVNNTCDGRRSVNRSADNLGHTERLPLCTCIAFNGVIS